ncbi:unnamed protein product [Auanema sp. JU1783]|nr:unnamed protein product [Auanema sp. JU1783]
MANEITFHSRYDNNSQRIDFDKSVKKNWKAPVRSYEVDKSSLSSRTASPIEKVKEIAEKSGTALDENLLADLKSVFSGKNVHEVNGYRRKMVEEMYYKTQNLISDAAETYSMSYFLAQENLSNSDMPKWKKELVAKKKSAEALCDYERNAWEEFMKWKKRYAPSVALQPEFHYSLKPKLK